MVTFCPLKLSYGRTIHTFQGQTAGPAEKNKPPNAVSRIICDPGDRGMEAKCPGLFYTSVSRATTIGNENKPSAIYFMGNNMNMERITDLTLTKQGKPYKLVTLRQKWVNHLKKNTKKSTLTNQEKKDLLQWASNTYISLHELDECLSSWDWRKRVQK